MEWWDDTTFVKHDPSTNSTTRVKVTCAPAQHWGCRNPFDRNIRLWCSWAVETIQQHGTAAFSSFGGSAEQRQYGKHDIHDMLEVVCDEDEIIPPPPPHQSLHNHRLSFYFAGDTGLPTNDFPLHRQIGDRLGPFDLSALPIGAYMPNNFIGDSHISPMEARQIHKDLRSSRSIAIHWGTFPMGDEPFYEPPKLLNESWDASAEDEEEEDPFLLIRQGDFVLSDVESSTVKVKGEDVKSRSRTQHTSSVSVESNANDQSAVDADVIFIAKRMTSVKG